MLFHQLIFPVTLGIGLLVDAHPFTRRQDDGIPEPAVSAAYT